MIGTLFNDPVLFFQQLVLLIPAFLIAITVHELAHGLVADRLGDPTARLHGRLTLNPFPHIDPIGAIGILLAGFGWAKPVPVNAHNLRQPIRDMALVAGAGPLSNFLTALVLLVVKVFVPWQMLPGWIALPLYLVVGVAYQVNLMLGVFNLLPIPPLDGGHFLPYFLPRRSWSFIHDLERYGPMILLLLVMTHATRYIVQPVIVLVDRLLVSLISVFL